MYFHFLSVIKKTKKASTIPCLFSTLVPPSNLTQNKQEQFTPLTGREPSELLALM